MRSILALALLTTFWAISSVGSRAARPRRPGVDGAGSDSSNRGSMWDYRHKKTK